MRRRLVALPTEELRAFVQHFFEGVVSHTEVETMITTTDIDEGETVSLTMQGGVLQATSGDTRHNSQLLRLSDGDCCFTAQRFKTEEIQR